MATHPPPHASRQHQQQHHLPRLFIPPGNNLNSQQPVSFIDGPMFSPALPTSLQHGMHAPPFPIQPQMHHHHPLQTPMQPSFFPPQPPNAPGRPTHGHRPHPSVVQLAAAGILPPPGMGVGMLGPHVPITPLGQNVFAPQMMPMPFARGHGQNNASMSFQPKSRRTQSVSTGGPPKAVLGGPQRKVSPMPVLPSAAPLQVAPQAPTTPAPPPVKVKKVVVNLPKEKVEGDETENATRPTWARTPLPLAVEHDLPAVTYPELSTAEAFPPDSWRYHLPPTVDVFLPGKVRSHHCSLCLVSGANHFVCVAGCMGFDEAAYH